MQTSDTAAVGMLQRAAMRWALGVAAVAFAASTIWIIWSDPYNLFRWRGADPYNSVLDSKMRFVKTLRAYFLESDGVLLGSSTVYRGLDPSACALPCYNFGISGMRITEMEGYARLISAKVRPRKAVLALDFFMFDALRQSEPGYEAHADQMLVQGELLARALGSGSAAWDAAMAWRSRQRPSTDGRWDHAGYKFTYLRTAKDIEWILDSTRREYRAMRYDSALFMKLQQAIMSLRAGGTQVVVVLSPVNPAFASILGEVGKRSEFDAYRREAMRVATSAGAQFHDFTDFVVVSDLSGGSDSSFIDVTHYQPAVGRQLLARMGLAPK
ncbi:hypothetical protein [Variovorax sp. MHTC-1]|uniref:hypothetical protein n=1 Tax=Variovorax sp. MHTC-1 TaxID=2495593 RepID=UPI000F87CC08|nr:hypothetical protein [Variovorax sp. MHTC-1]RST56103.1 hypothetical protein EJI01_04920 [Variovorax sp. MHTC-1]